MSTIEGADWAFVNPDLNALYRAGLRFAMRYTGPGSAPKHLTIVERDAIWGAGLDICLLVEGAGNDALQGYAKGVEFGHLFVAGAASLGAPDAIPGYVAVDFDCTATQWPTVRDHLRGFASVAGLDRTGVYGSWDVIQWAKRDGVARWFFQAYAPAWSNWRNAATHPADNVQQYRNNVTMGGASLDRCRAYTTDFGQWPASPLPPIPPGGSMSVWDEPLNLPALDVTGSAVASDGTLHIGAEGHAASTWETYAQRWAYVAAQYAIANHALLVALPEAIRTMVREEINNTRLVDDGSK